MAGNKYRSVYTGIEIDNLLASVIDKVDRSVIMNTFNGGTTLVASAELAKILKGQIDELRDPAYLKNLISNSIIKGDVALSGNKILLAEFDSTKATGAKVVIGCKSAAGNIQLDEVLYGKSNTATHLSVTGTSGQGGLYTLAVVTVGARTQLIATALVNGLKFTAERTALV